MGLPGESQEHSSDCNAGQRAVETPESKVDVLKRLRNTESCCYPQQRSDGCVQAHEWGGEQKGEQENAPGPRVITAIDLAHTHGQRFQ